MAEPREEWKGGMLGSWSVVRVEAMADLGGIDRYDDCLDIEETEVGQLALKRLEAKEAYDRVYRLRRAVQLSLQQKILPKEQWTTREQVSLYLSLSPIPSLCSSPPVLPLLRFAAPVGGVEGGKRLARAIERTNLLTTPGQQDKPYISHIIAQIEAEKKEKAALDTMEVVKGH